jgi:pectate lyase
MSPLRQSLLLLLVGGMFTEPVWSKDQCKPIGWATRSGRTGGAFNVTGGGSATPIVVTTFADLQKYVQDNQPRVLHVSGTLGSGWAGTTGDRLEIKASNKTIVGLKAGTILKAPIHISNNAQNIIVRNLVINGPGSNTDQAWDNINIEGGAKNVWIDHCEFWDGQDGNADVVKGADNVTFTWSIFGYKKGGPHNLSNLIASSDNEPVSVGKLNVTFMFNWWTGAAQRQPRCRYGNIHVVNNLFTKDGLQSDYGVSAGFDCEVRTENNHFLRINSPIYTSHKAGTSAHTVTGNLFEATSGNQTGYGTAFTPPYEYKSMMVPAAEVKALVQKLAGATLPSPTSCATSTGIEDRPFDSQEGPKVAVANRNLLLRDFEASQVDLLLMGADGRVFHRITAILQDGTFSLDLSKIPDLPSVALVSIRAAGNEPVLVRIPNLH